MITKSYKISKYTFRKRNHQLLMFRHEADQKYFKAASEPPFNLLVAWTNTNLMWVLTLTSKNHEKFSNYSLLPFNVMDNFFLLQAGFHKHCCMVTWHRHGKLDVTTWTIFDKTNFTGLMAFLRWCTFELLHSFHTKCLQNLHIEHW